jgi:hypothetical protein
VVEKKRLFLLPNFALLSIAFSDFASRPRPHNEMMCGAGVGRTEGRGSKNLGGEQRKQKQKQQQKG